MSLFGMRATQMVDPSRALPGRRRPCRYRERHAVLGTPLAPPYPAGTEIAEFALGCFWGEERKFWQTPGVVSTSVGYEGGYTPNPAYEEVCSGRTGHAETVRVVFDPAKVSYAHAAQGVLGVARPDAGHAPGQRRRYPVPFGDLLPLARRRRRPRRSPARSMRRSSPRRVTAPSPRRSSRPESSTSPRTITSSTWTRIRSVTAPPRHRRELPGWHTSGLDEPRARWSRPCRGHQGTIRAHRGLLTPPGLSAGRAKNRSIALRARSRSSGIMCE